MTPSEDPAVDVACYARLRARLAAAGHGRAALLAAYGLDEEGWDRLDDRWQSLLSEALDEAGDGVPALVQRFAEAFAEAQGESAEPPLSLEQFARCTKALQGARDAKQALSKRGVTFAAYMKANHHWAPKLARDRALTARFQQLMVCAPRGD